MLIASNVVLYICEAPPATQEKNKKRKEHIIQELHATKSPRLQARTHSITYSSHESHPQHIIPSTTFAAHIALPPFNRRRHILALKSSVSYQKCIRHSSSILRANLHVSRNIAAMPTALKAKMVALYSGATLRVFHGQGNSTRADTFVPSLARFHVQAPSDHAFARCTMPHHATKHHISPGCYLVTLMSPPATRLACEAWKPSADNRKTSPSLERATSFPTVSPSPVAA